MIFETALYNYLSGHTGLKTLVDNRIYPLKLPQNPTYPAVVYQDISTTEITAMGTNPGMYTCRYQFKCFGSTKADSKAAAQQIRLAFRNYWGTMGGAGGVTVDYAEMADEHSEYFDETKSYCTFVDVMITFKE